MQVDTYEAALDADPGSMDQAAPAGQASNLVIRLSSPMVDQGPVSSWPNTSTSGDSRRNMPQAPKQNNECGTCRNCWNPEIKNISYGKH